MTASTPRTAERQKLAPVIPEIASAAAMLTPQVGGGAAVVEGAGARAAGTEAAGAGAWPHPSPVAERNTTTATLSVTNITADIDPSAPRA